MKKISIVCVAYNEEDNIIMMYEALKKELSSLRSYTHEICFVDNGSFDETYVHMMEIQKKDSTVQVIKLISNAEYTGGIVAGLKYATGDAAIIIAADLQEPPELMSSLIKKWEEGYLEVRTEINKRRDDSLMRTLLSNTYYSVSSFLSNGFLERNTPEFRLLDKSIYKQIENFPESKKYLRAIWKLIDAKSTKINYDRRARERGISKYPFKKTFFLAVGFILNFSNFTLIILSILSAFSLLGVLIDGGYLFWNMFNGVEISQWHFLFFLMLLFFSMNFFVLLLTNYHLMSVLNRVNGRPDYIVERVVANGNESEKN